ncbi:ATP-grasp domain-containing protein [Streptosporangium sp. NPDC051022]|uniref:ATP-grasp domain-containing protein n=1 Tax=Streptosporangium sp. NPDC051022 TaxID=3155752 RepID=UPI00341FF03B
MTKVAIVDGYSTGSVLGRTLYERAAHLVHVQSADHVPDYFRRAFRPGDYRADLGYVADLETLIGGLAGIGVDQVVAGTESGVILADTLNHRLGTPSNSPHLVTARRDKSLMAQAVAAAGLATPRGQVFDTVAQAVAWYTASPFDEAVVKPIDSAGTDNVWFCAGAEQVRLACERVLGGQNLYGKSNTQVLVQERVRGTEVYANTVSHEGVHRVAEMWRYIKRAGPTGTPVYDYEEPVDVGSAEAEGIRRFVFAVLDALGIRSSAAHTEIMLTERGPVLIETGARLGGVTMPDVVEKFSGVSQTALLADTLLDRASLAAFDDRKVRWAATVRNVALINSTATIVHSTDWISRIAELPSCVAVAANPVVGAEMFRTVDLISSPGFVYLASEDSREVDRDYRKLRQLEQFGLYSQ